MTFVSGSLGAGAIILMWPVWKTVTILSGSLGDWGHHINVASLETVTIVSGSLRDVASLEDGDLCIR